MIKIKKILLLTLTLILALVIVGCNQQAASEEATLTEEDLEQLNEDELDLVLASGDGSSEKTTLGGQAIKVKSCQETSFGVEYSKKVKKGESKISKAIARKDGCRGKYHYDYFCASQTKVDWVKTSCSDFKDKKSQPDTKAKVTVRECVDNDQGKNFDQQSSVELKLSDGNSQTFNDKCTSSGLLLEAYCKSSNTPGVWTNKCENGCEKGACLPDVEVPQLPPVPGQCASNDDCDINSICSDGECVVNPELVNRVDAEDCQNNDQCDANSVCSDGECVVNPALLNRVDEEGAAPVQEPRCDGEIAINSSGTLDCNQYANYNCRTDNSTFAACLTWDQFQAYRWFFSFFSF